MKPFWKPSFGAQEWQYFLVPKTSQLLLNEKGGRLYAKCDFERCRVYLSNALKGAAFRDALWHETFHAWLFASGADAAYGKDADIEEALVIALTPVAQRFFADMGFCLPVKDR